MNKANQASSQVSQLGDQLRGVIANLDDYKLQTTVAVPFKFDKYQLTSDGRKRSCHPLAHKLTIRLIIHVGWTGSPYNGAQTD